MWLDGDRNAVSLSFQPSVFWLEAKCQEQPQKSLLVPNRFQTSINFFLGFKQNHVWFRTGSKHQTPNKVLTGSKPDHFWFQTSSAKQIPNWFHTKSFLVPSVKHQTNS